MVGFETSAAHSDETVRRRAVLLTVRQIGRIVGRCCMLTINPLHGEGGTGGKDPVLRGMDKVNAIAVGILQYLSSAHGPADSDAFRDGM